MTAAERDFTPLANRAANNAKPFSATAKVSLSLADDDLRSVRKACLCRIKKIGLGFLQAALNAQPRRGRRGFYRGDAFGRCNGD